MSPRLSLQGSFVEGRRNGIWALALQGHKYRTSVSHSKPAYNPVFTGTHCAYPQREGQAELTRVVGNHLIA